MEKIKILVCAHQKGSIYQNNVYMPVQGGKSISSIDLGIQGDDTGDNISEKNKRYCESSVLYWGWKNLKDVEYIGLAHYRRRFKLKITADNIDGLMSGIDFIVVKPRILHCPIVGFLNNLICGEDVYIFIDTILDLYPNYRKTIIDYYYTSNKFIPYSLFITRRKDLDNYCDFLYNILFKVEKRIRPANYTRLNRSLAYMGEFLLGLYCMHNNLKLRYLEMQGEGEDTRPGIIRCVSHLKRNLQFSLFSLGWHIRDIPSSPEIISGLKQDGIYLPNIENKRLC